jgi:hypothetical protein
VVMSFFGTKKPSTICFRNRIRKARQLQQTPDLHERITFLNTVLEPMMILTQWIELTVEPTYSAQKNCIVFKVCTQKYFPSFFKNIEYQYYFSDSPTNYHNMFYNGQMETSNSTYFWLFGFWIEFGSEIEALLDPFYK